MREPGERLVGNVVIDADLGAGPRRLAGFENHGGRTYLGTGEQPLGKVVWGFGNNGKDGAEGVRRGRLIGTYLHGPLLPKNAWLTDVLIAGRSSGGSARPRTSKRSTTGSKTPPMNRLCGRRCGSAAGHGRTFWRSAMSVIALLAALAASTAAALPGNGRVAIISGQYQYGVLFLVEADSLSGHPAVRSARRRRSRSRSQTVRKSDSPATMKSSWMRFS